MRAGRLPIRYHPGLLRPDGRMLLVKLFVALTYRHSESSQGLDMKPSRAAVSLTRL